MNAPRITTLLVFCFLTALPGASGAGTGPPGAALSPEERLWQAARDGDLAALKTLLQQGVPVDARTEFDCTALYFAVNANQPEAMKVLLEAGADINVRDSSYGFSAMAMAGWLGHEEPVGLLIDAGIGANDVVGAYFAAIGNGHAGTVQTIIDKGKVPKAQLDSGLGAARQAGADDVVKVLLRAGAEAPAPPEKSEAVAETEPDAQAEPKTGPSVGGPDDVRAEPRTVFDAALDRSVRVRRAGNWPEFRGAGRSGVADGQHPPVIWNLDDGRNVAWRVPIEGHGYSSPVVWKNRVFITTAISPSAEQTIDDGGLGWIAAVADDVEHRWQVRAHDLETGNLLWARDAHVGVPRSRRHWKASQANPTCATDGKTLVAHFGSEGLYAYDMKGNLLWQRDLGVLNAGWYIDATFEWGYASSPVIHDGKVFLQVDRHGRSFVAAHDLKTGKEIWRADRDEIPAWGTPLVYRGPGRTELVLNASKAVVGYDPDTGKELWRVRDNSPITVASPVADSGLIVATGGYKEPKPIYVVPAGATGDLTPDGDGSSSMAWSSRTDGVYIVTPLIYRGVLYLCKNNGVLTAFDLATGKEHYKERLDGKYTASPVAADGRIYFTSEDGDVFVIEAGSEFRLLASNEIGASALASPAISSGRLVFRTVGELVAVGYTPEKAARLPATGTESRTASRAGAGR